MFLAKAAQHSLHTLFEPPYRTHSQNQKTESHRHLKNGDDHDQDDFTHSPPSDFLHHPRTPAEFEELEEEENAKMSRNSNNGKRHKNHAGHKASKHRKNNKGNKANNSHSGHHNNKHRGGRNNNRAIRGTGEGWYAVAAMQGRRPHMEDTYHVLVPDASGPAAGDLHSLFGVFDGHGGKKVAQYLKENLLPAIVEAYANEKEVDGNDPNQQRTPTDRLQAILPRTFLEIDEQCMADDRLSGSTAVVAILTETDIVVANVGDSRGIIYRTNEPSGRKSASRARSNDDDDDDCPSDASLDSAPSEDDATDDDNYTDTDNDTDEEFVTDDDDEADVHVKGKAKQVPGQEEGAKKEKKKKRKYRKKPEEGDVGKTGRWQALSVDHKPNRPDERDRVEQAGGRVSKRPNDVWRFQNVLAVSRAFGDHGLKAGPGGAGLTANPEIKVFPRQDSDKFFVLASDGLWDVYTNEQAARVGRNALLQSSKNPAQEVANALANGAYKKESLDNITALVVLIEEATTDSSSSSLSSSSDSATSPSLYTRSLHSEL